MALLIHEMPRIPQWRPINLHVSDIRHFLKVEDFNPPRIYLPPDFACIPLPSGLRFASSHFSRIANGSKPLWGACVRGGKAVSSQETVPCDEFNS